MTIFLIFIQIMMECNINSEAGNYQFPKDNKCDTSIELNSVILNYLPNPRF